MFNGGLEVVTGGLIATSATLATIPSAGVTAVGVIAAAGLIAHGAANVVAGLATPGPTANRNLTKQLALSGKLMTPGGLVAGVVSGGNSTAITIGAALNSGYSAVSDLWDFVTTATTGKEVVTSFISFYGDLKDTEDDIRDLSSTETQDGLGIPVGEYIYDLPLDMVGFDEGEGFDDGN